jgi:hypothetical protein
MRMALETFLKISEIIQERQTEIEIGAVVLALMAEPLYFAGKKIATKTVQYFKEINELTEEEKKDFMHYTRGDDPLNTNYGI